MSEISQLPACVRLWNPQSSTGGVYINCLHLPPTFQLTLMPREGKEMNLTLPKGAAPGNTLPLLPGAPGRRLGQAGEDGPWLSYFWIPSQVPLSDVKKPWSRALGTGPRVFAHQI